MTTSNGAGRRSARFRSLRADFLRKCKANNVPCWLCSKPIDYTLPYKHPEAFNLDHAIPLSVRPELADDHNNFRSSHAVCNSRRGADEPFLDIGVPSEQW